jgi:hypothetical protein
MLANDLGSGHLCLADVNVTEEDDSSHARDFHAPSGRSNWTPMR